MRFDILTLFPEMFEPMNHSILNRAKNNSLIKLNMINIRDYSKDKHKHVDDTPYGGGAGMVMKPDIVYDAYCSIEDRENAKCIYLSPQGKPLNQQKVKELSKEEHLILLCGHYEGIDNRVIEKIVDEEISIGDYVLTGGELPAMVLIDAVSRYVDGVLTKESLEDESFTIEDNYLEYPQYTKPYDFLGDTVPDILLSGNHQKIDDWRKEQSLITTAEKRPELLSQDDLNKVKILKENLREEKENKKEN